MKRKKTIIITLAIIFHVSLIIVAAFNVTRASVDKLPELKNGDIVFQTSKTSQTPALIFATNSLYTHVGIIRVADSGAISVVEAVGPVREVPMSDWIARGVGDRITIKRMNDMNETKAQAILASAKSHSGKPYDPFFSFDKDKIYCSELVYYAFKDGGGLDIGKVEKFGDLNVSNIVVTNLIKERWQYYPLCKEQGANSYEKCNELLQKQALITPVSIADDVRFTTVYSNFY